MILEQLSKDPKSIDFKQVIKFIDTQYHFTPTAFKNGKIINEIHQNNGSCKVFSFAKIHQLNEEETLYLFGAFYREDVLNHPEADNHQNIRHFMKYGWKGIEFDGVALTTK